MGLLVGAVDQELQLREATVVDRLRHADLSSSRHVEDAIRSLMTHVPGAYAHAVAVAAGSRETARDLRVSREELSRIEIGALIHDIGKAVLPESILRKPGALDPEEQRLIRRHPEVGCRIARQIPAFAGAADVILASHERYDGTGYPAGIAGEDIPLASRIIAVADAYDVMTQRGTYCVRMSPAAAMEELQRGAGSQFDPFVTAVACSVLGTERSLHSAAP